MLFSWPIKQAFQIKEFYGERKKRHQWRIDPDNGLWIKSRDNEGYGNHVGTDFSCPSGTLVRAMADGFIVRARFENHLDHKQGAGLYIFQLINLPGYDSWVLHYAHLRSARVKPGDQVCRFDVIAESGDTGNVSEPYLHCDLMSLRHQWRAIPFDGSDYPDNG